MDEAHENGSLQLYLDKLLSIFGNLLIPAYTHESLDIFENARMHAS